MIAIPRLKKYGEHVDDHQIQLIEQFENMDIIEACYNSSDLRKAYSTCITKKYKLYKSNTNKIILSIDSFINNIETGRDDKNG